MTDTIKMNDIIKMNDPMTDKTVTINNMTDKAVTANNLEGQALHQGSGITRSKFTLTAPRPNYPVGRVEGLSDTAMTLVEGIIDHAICVIEESFVLDPARDMLLSVLTAAAGHERAQAIADDYDHVVMPTSERQKVLLPRVLATYDGASQFSRWSEEAEENKLREQADDGSRA